VFGAIAVAIFAGAVASCLAAHLASAQTIGRQALAGLAVAHGYDTAYSTDRGSRPGRRKVLTGSW
jgi:hypothetical protein